MAAEVLNEHQLEQLAEKLPLWEVTSDKLQRNFVFTDFSSAFEFMKNVAEVATKLNHHPDWQNSYNKVSIALRSHEAGGVSYRDAELAQAIDDIWSRKRSNF